MAAAPRIFKHTDKILKFNNRLINLQQFFFRTNHYQTPINKAHPKTPTRPTSKRRQYHKYIQSLRTEATQSEHAPPPLYATPNTVSIASVCNSLPVQLCFYAVGLWCGVYFGKVDDPQRIVDDNEINEDGGSSVIWVSYPLLGYLPTYWFWKTCSAGQSFIFCKKPHRSTCFLIDWTIDDIIETPTVETNKTIRLRPLN